LLASSFFSSFSDFSSPSSSNSSTVSKQKIMFYLKIFFSGVVCKVYTADAGGVEINFVFSQFERT
jgi:hypothetical protein